MTGKTKARPQLHLGSLALALLAAACYLYGVMVYLKLPENSCAAVFLSGNCPATAEVQRILGSNAEQETPLELCFLTGGGIENVSRKAYARQTEAMAVGLQGDASLYDWRCRGLGEEDYEGCIIDRSTAVALFGSAQAEGGSLEYQDRTYVVRKVTNWQQPMLVYRPEQTENVYTTMYVKPKAGESKGSAAKKALMSCGLSGTVSGGSASRPILFLALLLLPAAIGIRLIKTAAVSRKGLSKSQPEYWLWTVLLLLPVLAAAFLLTKYVRISPDWIPGKWSDFSFWSKKWSELKNGLFWYLIMPKAIWQAEGILMAAKGCAAAVVALAAYFLCIRKKRNTE